MKLRYRVADVLEEPAVRRINFQLGRLPVTSFQLKHVAEKIRLNKTHVYIHHGMSHSAEYVPVRDSILLQDEDVLTSTYGKSAVVHEGGHAMTDLNKAVSTTLYSAEVAAYLAQIIYDLVASKGNSKFEFKAKIMNPAGRIAREALRLIKEHDMTNKTVNLKWKQYKDLREAIKAHPKYNWDDMDRFPAGGIAPKVPEREDVGCSMASNAAFRGSAENRDVLDQEVTGSRQSLLGREA